MTKIMKCKVENILGVSNVEFAPNGNSVTIGGANGQGKTSTIWALVMALGGKDKMPLQPVHSGADKGEVVVELENMRVRLTVLEGRKSTLTVESLDGALYKTPQTMLNALFKNLAFDPGEFKGMAATEQRKLLSKLVGLDFSELDKEREQIYEGRRLIGQDIKRLEAKVQPVDESLPAEELSIEQINASLKFARQKIDEKAAATKAVDQQAITVKHFSDKTESCKNKILELQKQIEECEKQMTEAADMYLAHRGTLEKLQNAANEIEVPSTEELGQHLNDVQEKNAKIRSNNAARAVKAELDSVLASKEEMTCRLQGIEQEKAQKLSEVAFPVSGLSFSDEGIQFNGVPFEQIAESQQWEISTAIGFALNPQGIVFMRASGGLDKRSRERVRERAASLGVQLFLEVVDDAEDVQIVIEEGTVSANRLE